MILLEVLQDGSVGYGGRLIAPGQTFLCDPKYVADIVARKLAKIAGDTPPKFEYEIEGLKEEADERPIGPDLARAEDRKNLIDELVSLGITPAAKTNTKTLRGLVQRARMEARQ